MKKKEQIETIVAVCFFVLTAIILGSSYISQNNANKGAVTPSNSASSNSGALTTLPAASAPVASDGSGQVVTAYLPNGTPVLDTSLIDGDHSVFKQLLPPTYPTVSNSDIGNQDLFHPLP